MEADILVFLCPVIYAGRCKVKGLFSLPALNTICISRNSRILAREIGNRTFYSPKVKGLFSLPAGGWQVEQ